jgi:hypothetical protein
MPEKPLAQGEDAKQVRSLEGNAVAVVKTRPLISEELPAGEPGYLTAEEVSQRYRRQISVGTLRNWRALRVGPAYIKVGKLILYPRASLDDWDRANLVSIPDSNRKRSEP